ncbi:MAG: hypothetical protein ABIJ41_05540, partial [Candidatus Omnitrophota bacterium]
DVRPAKQGEISPKIKDFGRKGESRTLRSSNMKRSEIFERSRVRYSAFKLLHYNPNGRMYYPAE